MFKRKPTVKGSICHKHFDKHFTYSELNCDIVYIYYFEIVTNKKYYYVGSTVNPRLRQSEHRTARFLYRMKTGKTVNLILLKIVDIKKRHIAEQYYLDKFIAAGKKVTNKNLIINVKKKANRNRTHSVSN